MKYSQQKTFLQGVMVLTVAHVMVKIIGATFKIPLTYIVGPEGYGIFITAYSIYSWAFVIATAGLPVAISKLVSESVAVNNYKQAHKIFNIAFYLLSTIGIVGTIILFFGAGFLTNIIGNPSAYLSVIAISPALLFVSLMSVYRGYFQGMQNMMPTAISEVVEALGKLIIGYLLAYLWLIKGVEYASAGATLGVSVGTLLGAVILYGVYRFSQKKLSKVKQYSHNIKVKSTRQIFVQLVKISIPITLGASVLTLTNAIDLITIMNRLVSIGFSYQEANELYGYLGYAVNLFNFPPTMVSALAISVVPAVARALTVQNYRLARKTTESTIRIALLFALPAGMGLSLLSEPILQLVYQSTKPTQLLALMGIASIFVCLVLVTSAILQSTGKVMIPVRNMFIGGVVKIMTN
ncbi:polysaccharide biosynthesis protein [Petroclostridium sp. X23]|uniref:putative polysaccharide biosynthesis protein n=1 Tax=Petroclostridium sp. X23 TaxID=3045146 RepID=UPI0024AD22DC|nr:polysaccharide biosynthesis protein [Petroclostridium sp. X23]WHH56946.1 polysaccharide biosynthesis protein [Petroclostridium sp. X23]